MRNVTRIVAGFLLLAGLVTWALTGANRGWTKTSEPVTFVDEVTGLEGISYQMRFRPGVDFLGGVGLGAGLLFGISFLFRKSNPSIH